MRKKTIALIEAGLDTNALDLVSRAAEDLRGEPVLRRLVRGLVEFASVFESVAVLCPEAARPKVDRILAGLPVSLHQPGPDDSRRTLYRRGRKWALSSWRSGLANLSVYDEWGTPADYARVLKETGAEALVKVPVPNPLVDGELLDRFVEAVWKTDNPVSFLSTPPGFNFEYYTTDGLAQILQQRASTREVLALFLDRTNRDPVLTDVFQRVEPELIEGRFRVAADTLRGLEVVRDLAGAIEPGPKGYPAARVERYLLEHPAIWRRRLPREVEFEITGRDDLAAGFAPRPRAAELPLATFTRAARELASYDDALVSLGSLGEPLLHPEFPRFLEEARNAGVWGLHVATNGVHLEGDLARAILDARVDVVTIALDAATPETYKKVHGADLFDRVVANIEAFSKLAGAQGKAPIFIVPELTKSMDTIDDLEPFFDRFYRAHGWAVLRPFNDYAGQVPDRNPLALFPSTRSLCQKITHSLVVHSDGRVPVCSQDYLCRWPAGSLATSTLEEIWTGAHLEGICHAHNEGRFDTFPLCASCRDWHSV